MALTDHVAILTHHSLAQATPNKMKAGNPLEFYALIALPPAAGADLGAIATVAANGAPLGNFEMNVSTNAQAKKPIAGIPADWFVIRGATQFAPYIADATGAQLDQANPEHQQIIRSTFYAGKKVRAALSAFSWNYQGKHGISFNLSGVMDAGEQGVRLAIGNGEVVNAFQKYANPNAAPAAVSGAGTQAVAAAPAGNPFAAQQGAQPAQSVNPFAQTAPLASANPFATVG